MSGREATWALCYTMNGTGGTTALEATLSKWYAYVDRSRFFVDIMDDFDLRPKDVAQASGRGLKELSLLMHICWLHGATLIFHP